MAHVLQASRAAGYRGCSHCCRWLLQSLLCLVSRALACLFLYYPSPKPDRHGQTYIAYLARINHFPESGFLMKTSTIMQHVFHSFDRSGCVNGNVTKPLEISMHSFNPECYSQKCLNGCNSSIVLGYAVRQVVHAYPPVYRVLEDLYEGHCCTVLLDPPNCPVSVRVRTHLIPVPAAN